MKKVAFVSVVLALAVVGARFAFSHCEVPCGIYDDELRVKLVAEHITTVEKAMKQVVELGKAGDKNYNQIVRWIDNKEIHANEIQHIMAQYFLTQRVKPADPSDAAAQKAYLKKLELIHKIIVHAMKAKQTTDQEHIDQLRSLLDEFKKAYFG